MLVALNPKKTQKPSSGRERLGPWGFLVVVAMVLYQCFWLQAGEVLSVATIPWEQVRRDRILVSGVVPGFRGLGFKGLGRQIT